MACKIEIKQTLEDQINERVKSEGIEGAEWEIAQQKAKDINTSYKFDVVKVYEGATAYINKVVINIPSKLVDLYYAFFTNLETQEAAGVQAEDAKRAGEDFYNDYMFQLNDEVNYQLKSVDILLSERVKQIFEKGKKANWDLNKILTELAIPKEQKQLLLDLGINDREQLALELASKYGFSVEVNVAKGGKNPDLNIIESIWKGETQYSVVDAITEMPLKHFKTNKEATDYILNEFKQPTSYYSNLTSPGGINYTENEISTPLITPSIKGHAQFSTDKGIGWFRSDDEAGLKEGFDIKNTGEFGEGLYSTEKFKDINSKTRRVLEIQSDLFQKGRTEKHLTDDVIDENMKIDNEKNQFLQLLNKDNNWVTFFIKSIIQDSAKKGYEKVLFPKGETAAKIEGHQTIADEIENINEQIEQQQFDVDKFKENRFRNSDAQGNYWGYKNGEGKSFKSLEEAENYTKNQLTALEQKKQELKSQGIEKLKPIEAFYEIRVGNILEKQFGKNNVKTITDEYGNQWREITIDPKRDLQNILLQNKEVPASKSSPETLSKIKQAAQKMGINIQSLVEYAKNTSLDTKSINGVADLVKGVIAVAHGMENVTLTEEFVHIATAILEQTNPRLVTELISKIDRFKIYKATLEAYKNNKNYQLSNGKPNIRKIKKEAVDKLIAEVIINQSENTTEFPELLEEENISMIRQWWNTIKDYIKGIYRKNNIDIFEEAGKQVISGESGNVGDIASEGIFLQTTNNLVDTFYNKMKELSGRMTLIQEDISNKIKRHYTFDGKDVAKSVTEKTKASNKMPERIGITKEHDDQKRDWGIEGHEFIQNYIVNNLIDKDGFRRDVFLDTPIVTRLNTTIQAQLKSFVKELISSYRPGTRFLIEEMVINLKEKGMLGSTIDFKAIEPTEDGKDIRIDTLDWKFMGLKQGEEDVPWYEQRDWIPQMGEYSKIDREYGATSKQLRKARMIPFIVNYDYNVKGKPESGMYASSIEIGKLDSLTETNLYLLPVPSDEELKDNPAKALILALNADYEKLQKQHYEPEQEVVKRIRLKELSKAIRLLRLKLDFTSITNIGQKFLIDAKEAFKTFEDIDYKQLSESDLYNKQKELLEFKIRAQKFAKIDDTFLTIHPRETLSEEEKKTLNGYLDSKGNKIPGLTDIAASTDRMIGKITELQRLFAVQYAVIKEFTTEENKEDILTPEKEIGGIFKYLAEESTLNSTIMNFATDLSLNARSVVNINMGKLLTEFEKLLLPLEQFAKSQGKSAFDLIGKVKNGELHLIEKVDDKFKEELAKAKKSKDKKFLIANLNLEMYNKLVTETIERGVAEIDATIYSSNVEDNTQSRDFAKKHLKDSLEIESDSFNGYESSHFASLFNKARNTELHQSEEYKQLVQNKEAFALWNFAIDLNERAIRAGYIPNGSLSFFALIEASMLNKLAATSNILTESKDLFQDLYTVRINEENQYSSIDPDTNLPRKKIPKLFTRTDKELHQLSRDLTRVFPLWIKSLLEYENARNIEMTMLTLTEVEKSKGHIVIDKTGNIVWEGTSPKIDLSSNKNAELLVTKMDDLVYGMHEDTSSIGNVNLTSITEKLSSDRSTVDNKVISARKGLENMNSLTQSLAVGLRWMIAIPNYFGQQFQSFINNGGMYSYFGDYLPNHGKLITGIGLTTIQKGLIDLFVPLNGDPYTEARRKIAWKQGYIKWLGTWTMQDFMQSTNYLPEKNLQFTNALSLIDNAMVINGRIVNIIQYLRKQDEKKYAKDESGKFIMSQEERKSYDKSLDKRVKELQESSSLKQIAKIENDEIVIPGVSVEELAKFRTTIVEWGRNLNGQMSQENKAGYRRDILLKSFAMFRNWIVRQTTVRGHDIMENKQTHQWEYGRVRAFTKAYIQACGWNVFKMIDIINGTDKGLAILDEMLMQKKEDYYKKNGHELKITNEEFYDMMRQTLSNEMKELGVLLGLMVLMLGAKLAVPDDDEDLLTKNKYKYFLKVFIKIKNEVDFYYNPLSFKAMTTGSFLPALGTITNAWKAVESLGEEVYGHATGDDELLKKNHPLKHFMNVIPGPSQFGRDYMPLLFPDLAKELGYTVTSQPRIQQ